MDDDRSIHSALAISSGRVLATGELNDLEKWIGPETRTVDLNGRTVIPGLIDSHLHAVRGGRFFNLELRWEGVPTLREALDMLREQAARTPKGQWVRVIGGWSPFQFAERRMPTIEELNEAAPDTPVFVLFLYSQGLLNHAGMRALGLTPETEAPKGTRYELDGEGQLTGRLLAEPSPVILYKTIGKIAAARATRQRLNSTRAVLPRAEPPRSSRRCRRRGWRRSRVPRGLRRDSAELAERRRAVGAHLLLPVPAASGPRGSRTSERWIAERPGDRRASRLHVARRRRVLGLGGRRL